MTNFQSGVRQHGAAPSNVVVLHGGPGGAGEVEPLAKELWQRGHAVLEPFQTRHSVDGQVEELRLQILQYCSPPVALIGWSWGAWLGCLLAAQNKELVHNLILVGSGPFEAHYAKAIRATKRARLSDVQRSELKTLRPKDGDAKHVTRFIELCDVADTYQRDASPLPDVTFDGAIHETVWAEANEMRANGTLLRAVASIRCPVLAIHGDYDPRPSEGVQLPLQTTLPAARFFKLRQCGHKPWQEVHAKDDFYRLIESALT